MHGTMYVPAKLRYHLSHIRERQFGGITARIQEQNHDYGSVGLSLLSLQPNNSPVKKNEGISGRNNNPKRLAKCNNKGSTSEFFELSTSEEQADRSTTTVRCSSLADSP
jgi:hypothetical protein